MLVVLGDIFRREVLIYVSQQCKLPAICIGIILCKLVYCCRYGWVDGSSGLQVPMRRSDERIKVIITLVCVSACAHCDLYIRSTIHPHDLTNNNINHFNPPECKSNNIRFQSHTPPPTPVHIGCMSQNLLPDRCVYVILLA